MLTCKGASHLVSQHQDRPLSFSEKWGLRIHLWMCLHCRRFENQIGLMRRVLRQAEPTEDTVAISSLPTDAHERIAKALTEQS